MYTIIFQLNIKKYLKKIPKKDVEKILEAIEGLAKDPRPRWMEKLQSRSGYRIRVGDYRIIYTLDDGKLIICVIDVDHRKGIVMTPPNFSRGIRSFSLAPKKMKKCFG